jgi:hypothetical protein
MDHAEGSGSNKPLLMPKRIECPGSVGILYVFKVLICGFDVCRYPTGLKYSRNMQPYQVRITICRQPEPELKAGVRGMRKTGD